MHIFWDTEADIIFLVILDHFLPFYPPSPKNHYFEKLKKKTLGDIIISQMCTLNDNHIMYGSWDMEHGK